MTYYNRYSHSDHPPPQHNYSRQHSTASYKQNSSPVHIQHPRYSNHENSDFQQDIYTPRHDLQTSRYRDHSPFPSSISNGQQQHQHDPFNSAITSNNRRYDSYSQQRSTRYNECTTKRYDERSTSRYDEHSTGRYDEHSTSRYDEHATSRYDEHATSRYDEHAISRYDEHHTSHNYRKKPTHIQENHSLNLHKFRTQQSSSHKSHQGYHSQPTSSHNPRNQYSDQKNPSTGPRSLSPTFNITLNMEPNDSSPGGIDGFCRTVYNDNRQSTSSNGVKIVEESKKAARKLFWKDVRANRELKRKRRPRFFNPKEFLNSPNQTNISKKAKTEENNEEHDSADSIGYDDDNNNDDDDHEDGPITLSERTEGLADIIRHCTMKEDQPEDEDYNLQRLEASRHYVLWVDIHTEPDILYMRKVIRTSEAGFKKRTATQKMMRGLRRQFPVFWGSAIYRFKISEVFRLADKSMMGNFWKHLKSCKLGEKPNPMTPLNERTGIIMCCVISKKAGALKYKRNTQFMLYEYNTSQRAVRRYRVPFLCPGLEPLCRGKGASGGKSKRKQQQNMMKQRKKQKGN